MEIDFDPLEDIFANDTVKKARPVGKFQPKVKAKHRPTKRDVAAPLVSSSQPAQTIETEATDINKPVKDAIPCKNCLEVVFNDNEHGCASTENPLVETGDLPIGLETLGDILPNNITDMEGIAPLSEVSNPKNAKSHVLPVPDFPDDIIPRSEGGDVFTCPELSAGLDPLTAGEPFVSSGDGCDEVHDNDLCREEMDIMDSIILSELTTKSGQRRGMFLPKQNVSANEPIFSLASQSDQPESNYAENDSASTFRQDDMLDLSDLGLNHTLPPEVTLEIPLDKDSVDHMEATQIDSGIHVDVEPEIPVKLASRRAKSSKTSTASATSSQRNQASRSGKENEICRSLRPRKNKPNLCALDNVEEEVAAGEDTSDEIPISSAVEEDNVSGESQVDNETWKKVTQKRKPKKPDDVKEKPARKRKKAEEAQDKNESAKPKKFSHSMRRRRVDKALLETREGDPDYQKLTLRDLILIAEHKEQQTKKEAASIAGATPSKSNGNTSSHYKEHGPFNTRQHGEYNDGEANPEMEDTTVFFNYHSHMDRTPVTRWSKQETELFYEAVRQFGTDLSMIQQLFPDRTRRQVKLKYKKEERQHPLRLREALTHRSTDHSYFQKVIEQLQKMASEENPNIDNDDPVDLTGNDADEGASNVDKEESKEEKIEEEWKEDAAANDFEVQSPPNFDDFEEDESFWSQFK